jgi:hypothetical protein
MLGISIFILYVNMEYTMTKIKKSKLKERLVQSCLDEGFIDSVMGLVSSIKDKQKAKDLQKQVEDLEKEKKDVKKAKATIQKSIDSLINSQKDAARKERMRRLSQSAAKYYSLKQK